MSNKGQSKSLWEAEEGHAGASDEELHRARLLGQSLLQAGTARELPPHIILLHAAAAASHALF